MEQKKWQDKFSHFNNTYKLFIFETMCPVDMGHYAQ